jgi:hypothetical protein
MASRKAGDVMPPECSCTETSYDWQEESCAVLCGEKRVSVWAAKRKESECSSVCIRCGAVDVVIEVRCLETSGEHV